MDWKELKIYTAHEHMDDLSAALLAAGITGLVINDPEDIKEFAAQKSASWDYIDDDLLKEAASGEPFVTVYISDDEDGASLLEGVQDALSRLGGMGIECRTASGSVREEDWANEWKKYFRPLNIGKKLVVKPTWEMVEQSGRTVVELDPESSFGTGRHFTTQIALELLEDRIAHGMSVCDLGCGSGILFVSALLLGAETAVGIDISEDAMRISRKNALQNGISEERFRLLCGDVSTDDELCKMAGGPFDIVIANIVADVLLGMKDVFPRLTKRGGRLVLSGIIDGREDEVYAEVAARGFRLEAELQKDMWHGGVFTRG